MAKMVSSMCGWRRMSRQHCGCLHIWVPWRHYEGVDGAFFFHLPFWGFPPPCWSVLIFFTFQDIRPMKYAFPVLSYWYDFVVFVSILFLSGKGMVKKQFLVLNWEEAVFPLLIWLWPMHWNLQSDMEMSLSLHAWMKARWGFLVWACFVCFPQKLCWFRPVAADTVFGYSVCS